MREIRTSGSMSGERKRSDAVWPKPPRLSSTLLESYLVDFAVRSSAPQSPGFHSAASLSALAGLGLMGWRRRTAYGSMECRVVWRDQRVNGVKVRAATPESRWISILD